MAAGQGQGQIAAPWPLACPWPQPASADAAIGPPAPEQRAERRGRRREHRGSPGPAGLPGQRQGQQ
eukprot:8874680-Alexandrium_andersonii.AAC.1